MEETLDLKTLKSIKQSFDIYSDMSSSCHGYHYLLKMIEREEHRIASTPPQGLPKDNYEKEIEKHLQKNYDTQEEEACGLYGIEWFRDTIHAREMAKKDKEIKYLYSECGESEWKVKDAYKQLEQAQAEIERLKGLIGRYANHVDDSEGSNFLGMQYPCDYLNENERAEILALTKTDNP